MSVRFSNNAKTTLSAGITAAATSISVADGSLFPTLASGDYFYLTFDDDTNIEIVRCEDVTGNTLTVVRGQEGTTGTAFASGTKAELRLTAGGLRDNSGTSRFYARADEALSKGDAVYITGNVSGTPTVAKANASNSAKMPAFGLADEDFALNAFGYIVSYGELLGIDTATNFNTQDTLYVSATTDGALTSTPPTGEGNLIQNIGRVVRENLNNGIVQVGGAGRTNATPNLNNGNVFIGNASNQAVSRALLEADISDFGTYLTGNQTITLSGDVSGSGTTSIVVTVADDSHNHIISNVDGLQTALDAKAPLASPAFTGTPTAPTASIGTSTTQLATTAYVQNEGFLTAVPSNLTGVVSIYNTSLVVGRSSTTEKIDFGTSGQIRVFLANTEEFRFAAGGTFHADADVVAFSTTVASDEKLKYDIEPINNAIDTLVKLTGVTFKYVKDDRPSVGVIAQNVESVLPSAVRDVDQLNSDETYKSVDYNQLIGLLIEAVKEQQTQIDELTQRLGL